MKKIYYGKAVYNHKEIKAVNKVLRNNSLNLIDGPHVKKLEKVIIKKFGKKYGLMVNSGSSANLLALSSFNFKKGSEITICAAGRFFNYPFYLWDNLQILMNKKTRLTNYLSH